MKEKIAVLIPCFNEGKTIYKVVRDFYEALPDSVVYVCDNNSTDDTVIEAMRAGAVIKYEWKQGKGNVVRSMLREIDADCYLLVDGDDTYPASSANLLCRAVLSGAYDMMIGDRLSSTYFTENKRPFHNSGNILVRDIINNIFKSDLEDIMSGYRAIDRKLAKCMPIFSSGFEVETEMTIFALDKRYNVSCIGVDYKDRPEGSVSKLNTFSDGFRVLATIFRLFRDYKPFYFFSVISAVLFVISVLMFLPVFEEYILTGLVPRFPTLIVCCFVMLLSMLFLICGIILEVQLNHHRQMYEILRNHYDEVWI